MKTGFLLLALVLAASAPHAPTSAATNIVEAPKNRFVVPAFAVPKSYSRATPPLSAPRLWTNAPGLSTPRLLELPKPGVYKTIPYTCVVIVPGPHPDERMPAVSPRALEPNMPVVKPDLQFIPLK